MQCTQCGQNNHLAKFCVKCGAKLPVVEEATGLNFDKRPAAAESSPDAATEAQAAPAMERPGHTGPYAGHASSASGGEPNPHLQQAKQVSKQYLSFCLEVLKSPARIAQTTNAGHMVNGIITFILFSLLVPLIVYFQLKAQMANYGLLGLSRQISFGDTAVRTFFFLVIIVLLVNSVIFWVLKLGNAGVNYREVTGRFGAFMIPSVAFLVVSLVFSVLRVGSDLMGITLGLGLFSWFVAICFVIYSFKKDHKNGLDAFHGVIITYIASIILLALLGEDIAGVIFGGMGGSFNF